jgi:hypothetical protein
VSDTWIVEGVGRADGQSKRHRGKAYACVSFAAAAVTWRFGAIRPSTLICTFCYFRDFAVTESTSLCNTLSSSFSEVFSESVALLLFYLRIYRVLIQMNLGKLRTHDERSMKLRSGGKVIRAAGIKPE